MDILIMIAAIIVLMFGLSFVALILRFVFGKNLTYKLYLWLLPGMTAAMSTIYVIEHLKGFKNPIVLIIGLPIGVGIMVTNFIVVGKSLIRGLQNIAQELSESTAEINTVAQAVASSSQTLTEAAISQAAAIEETSSSLEEMASMTQKNADHSTEAKALMGEARMIVEKVDDRMNKMATAIQEVTRSSEATEKIVKTIDEISFQTNLLALNAAVEAARAGEAGAGFAVVADEVRNLALRAAEAAKNTSSLIENTMKTVNASRILTQETQKAFKENVEISDKVGILVDEIAVASQEQAQGISQINSAVAEMDKGVQQTAAQSEESASAAEEMTGQTYQMKGTVRNLVVMIQGTA